MKRALPQVDIDLDTRVRWFQCPRRGLGGDMAFKVGEAFNLLFGDEPAAGADGPSRSAVSYEERCWFRRPQPYDITQKQLARWHWDAKNAESILMAKVVERLPVWRDRLTAARAGHAERISEAAKSAVAELPDDLDPGRHLPPRSPYDVFAIAAYLMDAAGVYHHLQPEKVPIEGRECPDGESEHHRDSARHLGITERDRREVRQVAAAWRNLPRHQIFGSAKAAPLAESLTSAEVWPTIEPLFESWAVVFAAYADAEVFVRLDSRSDRPEPAPAWWKHVWRLFAIADEAANGSAFNFDGDSLKRALNGEDAGLAWFEAELFAEFATQILRENGGEQAPRRGIVADITSLSVARPEVLGVLPKVRTPSVGCTMRSMSHHLAMTPGRGIARGRWTPSFAPQAAVNRAMPDGQMNVLLVPYPYSIEAKAFCGAMREAPDPGAEGQAAQARYGYFDVHQHWLPSSGAGADETGRDRLTAFVRKLIDSARRHSPKIHAVVFPEMALDLENFTRIRDHIERYERDIELFIAGVSEKAQDVPAAEGHAPAVVRRRGNFVAVASFNRTGSKEDEPLERRRETVREKHHRWKLDRSQLRDYGLLGVLSPELQWWENIALYNRRIDFTVIRQRSVLSALICEDLARVDPCQQIIRSVAPNLVVALLMDAPQRSGRWPSRYATVLAEDPGCAVLTLTSRALMTRQHRLGLFASSGSDRIVALWRDDRSDGAKELNCPYDAQGLLLTIIEEQAEDISLDGRTDDSAIAFRYGGHFPVRIPKAKDEFSDVLGEEDRAC